LGSSWHFSPFFGRAAFFSHMEGAILEYTGN
jgi:hypothetical protein